MTIEKLKNKVPWNVIVKIEEFINGGYPVEITREPIWESYVKEDGTKGFRPTKGTRIKYNSPGSDM